VETCGTDGQATDGNIRRMRISCWMTKTKDTNIQNIQNLLFFHGNIGYANVSQYCVYTSNARLVCHLPSVESNDSFQGRFVTVHIEICGCCIELGVEANACFIKQFSVETLTIVFIYFLRGRRANAYCELCLVSFSVKSS
jgi:hypothetical protein